MTELERLSAQDLEAQSATPLPTKEVMSLLDLNTDVDLALDLAAPIDLAVAANLNLAAPITAAGANILSFGVRRHRGHRPGHEVTTAPSP